MDTHRPPTLLGTLRQIATFVGYVARHYSLFHVIVVLTLLVLVLEYAATSLMIPLSSSASAGGAAMQAWSRVLEQFGLQASTRTWLWLFFVIMAARLVFGYLQTTLTTLLGKRVHRTLSNQIFRHVIRDEPLTSVYTRSVGHYITLAGDDTFRCGTIITCLLQCAVGLCTALVAMAILLQFSAALFAAVLGFLFVCALTVALMLRYIIRLNARSTGLSRELNTAFVESLNSLRSIRALGGEQIVYGRYAAQIGDYVRMLFRIEAVRTGIKAFPAMLLLLVAAVLLRPGSALQLSETSLFAATIIVIRIFTALGQLVSGGAQLMTDMRAVRDIEALTQPDGSSARPAHAPYADPIRSLSLQHIHFGYGSRGRVLTDLSFRFLSGKTYAVVGPSGSGKSTLADLMLGLVEPDSGAFVINDERVAAQRIRGRLMLVEQQPKIFSTTLRDNLLFGMTAPDDALWDVLRLVDLEATVRRLPRGLDTTLSYLGENFSGGQRQRIGIARALLRRPDILILDEATSALDPATRASVVDNIHRHMASGIIIFITHDLEISGLADEVLDIAQHAQAGREAALTAA